MSRPSWRLIVLAAAVGLLLRVVDAGRRLLSGKRVWE